MTQPHVLLVGGTKMVERHLRKALPQDADLRVMRTMEQAMQRLSEVPVSLLVLGPSMRRSLAMVTTIRRDSPRPDIGLVVVYRDDQRENVSRHLEGRFTADAYVMQSKVSREIQPAIDRALGGPGVAVVTAIEDLDEIEEIEEMDELEELESLEELPLEAVSDVTGDVTRDAREAATVQMDIVELQAPPRDQEGTTQVMDVIQGLNADHDADSDDEAEVLGELDLSGQEDEVLGAFELSEVDELEEELELSDVQLLGEPAAAGGATEEFEELQEIDELEEIEPFDGTTETDVQSLAPPAVASDDLAGAGVVAEDLALAELDADEAAVTAVAEQGDMEAELLDDDELIEEEEEFAPQVEVTIEAELVEELEEELEELEPDLLLELDPEDAEAAEALELVEVLDDGGEIEEIGAAELFDDGGEIEEIGAAELFDDGGEIEEIGAEALAEVVEEIAPADEIAAQAPAPPAEVAAEEDQGDQMLQDPSFAPVSHDAQAPAHAAEQRWDGPTEIVSPVEIGALLDERASAVQKRPAAADAGPGPEAGRHRHQSSMEIMASNLSELSQIISRLQEATNEASRLEEENVRLREEVGQLQLALETSGQQADVVAGLARAQAAHEASLAENARLQAALEQAQQQAERSAAERSEALAQVEKARAQAFALQASLDEAREQVAGLEEQLRATQAREQAHRETAAGIAASLDELSVRLRA